MAESTAQSDINGVFNRLAGTGGTAVLTGRWLRAVRALLLGVFGVAVVVYSMDLFALWDEAHRLQYTSGPYDETRNFFGLELGERQLLTGSLATTPGWYPVFVVARQIIIDVAALGLAWLIFSRHPRHWMAYLATLFILLAPVTAQLTRDDNRLDGTLGGSLFDLLAVIAAVTLVSFLWLFPDGRFRGATAWLLGSMLGLLGFGLLMSVIGQDDPETTGTVANAVMGIWWMSLMALLLVWMGGGIALQIWRYRRTAITDRRLARWNLVFLVAVPLWFLPFEAFHGLFSDSDVCRHTTVSPSCPPSSLSGFVWEQIHETLYLIAPVLLGIWVLFLVRKQGWWDFQTLWNRTAVYGIGLVLLAALYMGALGVVTLAASPLPNTGEQVVAVVAATATVAFLSGPLIRRVRRWVDERWFPRSAEVDRLSLAFADELRTAGPDTVGNRLTGAVRASLDPHHVELWTAQGGDRP